MKYFSYSKAEVIEELKQWRPFRHCLADMDRLLKEAGRKKSIRGWGGKTYGLYHLPAFLAWLAPRAGWTCDLCGRLSYTTWPPGEPSLPKAVGNDPVSDEINSGITPASPYLCLHCLHRFSQWVRGRCGRAARTPLPTLPLDAWLTGVVARQPTWVTAPDLRPFDYGRLALEAEEEARADD